MPDLCIFSSSIQAIILRSQKNLSPIQRMGVGGEGGRQDTFNNSLWKLMTVSNVLHYLMTTEEHWARRFPEALSPVYTFAACIEFSRPTTSICLSPTSIKYSITKHWWKHSLLQKIQGWKLVIPLKISVTFEKKNC